MLSFPVLRAGVTPESKRGREWGGARDPGWARVRRALRCPPPTPGKGQRPPGRLRPGGGGAALGAQGQGRVGVAGVRRVQLEHRLHLGRRVSPRPTLGGVGPGLP